MSGAGNGDLALRCLGDLVEGGDVRCLFSDSELLELAAAEEECERKSRVRGGDLTGAAGEAIPGATLSSGASVSTGYPCVNSVDNGRGDATDKDQVRTINTE